MHSRWDGARPRWGSMMSPVSGPSPELDAVRKSLEDAGADMVLVEPVMEDEYVDAILSGDPGAIEALVDMISDSHDLLGANVEVLGKDAACEAVKAGVRRAVEEARKRAVSSFGS